MDMDAAGIAGLLAAYRAEMAKRIIGQEEMIDGLLSAFIAGGHILLEGAPGLAKTLAVKSFAELTGLLFKRIQFTPDLLPADLTGTLIWDQGTGKFRVRRGPVFANVILADEINRAPAKVQSALLEAMEERQVTIGENTYPLPEPFLVLATQNPIEHEGTYNLPEAQLDRFLVKLLVKYPKAEEEIRILEDGYWGERAAISPLSEWGPVEQGFLEQFRLALDGVRVDRRILEYMVAVVAATRPGENAPAFESRLEESRRARGDGIYRYISYGASPRASIALYQCCRIHALFQGRSFVIPEDVKNAAFPALRHRIVLSYEAEADGLDSDAIITRILALIPVP